jgi:D-alanyl-D-alanine carboxypeptidase/D-alanyl-D-alanine-endopeptidase (penicillin-binding protein 4)
MLTNSQNLYAECLFKRLGEGSFASGGAALEAALVAMEVPTAGLVARDGSGLSRENLVSARTLYGALQALRDEPLLVEALAAGGDGTLRRRYRDLGPRVRAKTGTIRGVSTLSGYVTGREGDRYVFVILANGASVARARRLQDLIVIALADS